MEGLRARIYGELPEYLQGTWYDTSAYGKEDLPGLKIAELFEDKREGNDDMAIVGI